VCVENFYYLCTQEVEEETGSAGEQLVSNKLPVLRCNMCRDGIYILSLFLCYRQHLMAKKTQSLNCLLEFH